MHNSSNIYGLPMLKASKAVILARVSSKEQEDGYSIDAQKHRLETYCARRNLTPIKTFAIVESSTTGDRRQFMALVKFVKTQKEAIALVADKVDRVQRSFKEYPLLDALIQQGKIELHFNTENYVIHKDSVSQERLMWSMGVIMAQSYIDSMRDNVKRSFEQKIRQGEWIAKAPVGYLNIKNERARGDVMVDPDRAPLVVKLFELYATGAHTIPELTKMAKIWGLSVSGNNNPLTRSHVHRLLQNPFYYGFMQIKGKLYEHRYEPLITRNLFEQCQAVLKGWHKNPFQYAKHEYVFRGILTCATTGRTVTADTKKRTYKNGSTAEWTYLLCWNPENPSKNQWVREDTVLEQVTEILRRLAVPADIMHSLKDYLRGTDQAERSFLQRQVAEWQKEHTLCQNRLDRLTDLLLDGTIEREEFHAKKTQLRQKQIELSHDIESAGNGDDAFKEVMLSLLDISAGAYDLFQNGTTEEKRKLVNFVFSNLKLQGPTLCYSLRKPFDQMLLLTNGREWRDLIDRLRTDPEILALKNCGSWAWLMGKTQMSYLCHRAQGSSSKP